MIIIEEPELHLHPTWQTVLMDLFIDLSKETKNQFILSTHSPSFITPKTINNVFRVYINDDTNKIKRIKDNLEAKELLHIVKSHNNEKMFFADKIALVEGISDRLIFEKLIRIYSDLNNKSEIIEVIDVGGKGYLQYYRKLLDILDVRNSIIADFDYLTDKNIGNENVRKLFKPNIGKICEKVIKDKKSQDCKSLMEKLDLIIKNGDDLEELEEIWCYIKGRFIKIKKNLTKIEKELINSNINDLKSQNIFILQKGEIEDYLPDSYRKLKNAIDLIKDENFHDWYEMEDKQAIEEIESIVFDIVEIEENKRQEISNKVKTHYLNLKS